MTKLSRQAGFVQLTFVVGLSVVVGITALYIQLESNKGIKASAQALNQLEGFYSSEIAALKSFHNDPEASVTKSRTLVIENNIAQGICHDGGCDLGPATQTSYGSISTLKDLWMHGKLRSTSLIRRYLAGATQIVPSREQPGVNTHCGAVTYSNNTIGAKTCLVAAPAPVACPATANGVDIVFVLDNSDSFRSSDPVGANGQTGRETSTLEAFDRVAGQAAPGSKVGLIIFNRDDGSRNTYYSWGWLDAVGANSAASRSTLATALLRTRNQKGSSDIGGGLSGARSLFQQVQNDGRKHIIFVVSEGIYDDSDPWASNTVADDLKNNMNVEIVDIHIDTYYMQHQELLYWVGCGYAYKYGFIGGCSRPGGGTICDLGNALPASTSCPAQTQTYINYMMGRNTVEWYAGIYADKTANPTPCRSYTADWVVSGPGVDLCRLPAGTYSGDGYSMGQRISSNMDLTCSSNCAKYSYGLNGFVNGTTNNISDTMNRYLSSLCGPTPTDPCDPTDPKGLITFETVAGATPSALTAITNQYQLSHGVRFSLIGGGTPVIAKVGGANTEAYDCDVVLHPDCQDPDGIVTSNYPRHDGARAGENIGRSFLTDDGILGTPPTGLIIDYDVPVDQASGGIIDIDGGEMWTIEARNSSGTVVDTKILNRGWPDTQFYDGREQRFSFDRGGANDITQIRLTPNNAGNFGLGFDNFSPSKVCAGTPLRYNTNTVGVVYEDASQQFDLGDNWTMRDIRACIQGDFIVEPSTQRILAAGTGPQTLVITSERRAPVACRHKFFIEVFDSAGNKRFEESHDTEASPAPPHTTVITVDPGDEIVLSWEWISNFLCTFSGRDPNTRLSTTRNQTVGPPQIVPVPKFYYDSCGDYSP